MTSAFAASTTAPSEIIPLRPVGPEPPKQQTAIPGRDMFVIALTDFDSLEEYIPAWEELARSALEPNPFYEAWMLIPALRLLGEGKSLQLVLVFARNQTRPNAPPVLCGVFPLERKPRYKGLPVSVLSLWKHLYCFLCTPLVRADRERECLSAFFDWLASDSRSPLVEFNYVSGEGPFHKALVDCLNERSRLSFVSDLYNRALFKPRASADQYLRAAMSREHRKDVKRRAKRFSEEGRVEFVALEQERDVDLWLEDFIRLEFGGWKREHGGAIGSKEEYRNYFTAVAKEAFRRGRLMMLGLRLDGRPVALKCNFLADGGGYAFKIAYDESRSRFSPGFLLEVENVHRLHARPQIEWMDSCAVPVHFMINRLWLDRRTIQTLLVSTGKRPGDLAVSLMPLIRWLNRKVRGVLNSRAKVSNNREDEKS
ncbi:MAG TPA: GNAT family N-acetyltransferase [Blastocatellia bacterium]|nr:GNAT family N-acetyltransferase [Blastocatellia bacterium]